MSFEQDLIEFIGSKYSVEIDEQEPLIDSGLIDSMALISIVTFVEKRIGTRIPDEDVTHENFQTVASIADLTRRLASQSTPPTE